MTLITPVAGRARRARSDAVELRLLPDCGVVAGDTALPLCARAQRLLALLALSPQRSLSRGYIAGRLWPDATASRAFASLRTTLRELPRLDPPLVVATSETVRLGSQVWVDWVAACQVAAAVLDPRSPCPSGRQWQLLRHGLLVGWSEEWLEVEQTAFGQLRVHALETMCTRLSAAGEHAQAVQAGVLAVAGDVLRESAHRELIRAHLAQGNTAAAVEQFGRLQRVLDDELGLRPSRELRDLVLGAMAPGVA